MTNIRRLAVLLSAVALSACDKNAVQQIASPTTGGAFVRFQNYGVNVPGVNFYANDQKITAVNSTSCTPPTDPKCSVAGIEATTGVAYGASGNGGNYAMLPPGAYTFSGRIAAATDNGRAVATTSATLAPEKFYTYFVSGIYNATAKLADSFIVEDVLPTSFDYTKSYIRVVNASVNAPVISASSTLQGTSTAVPVGSSVAYKTASPFITVAPGLSDLTLTAPGVSATFKGLDLVGGHVITITIIGDAASTSTTTGLSLVGVYNR